MSATDVLTIQKLMEAKRIMDNQPSFSYIQGIPRRISVIETKDSQYNDYVITLTKGKLALSGWIIADPTLK